MAESKTVHFEAIVRTQKSPLGDFGRINSKELAPFIGKKVRVMIEVIE